MTFASIYAQVWFVLYISGRTDSRDQIGVHGGLDARLDAASIRPSIETCPSGSAQGTENVTVKAAMLSNVR